MKPASPTRYNYSLDYYLVVRFEYSLGGPRGRVLVVMGDEERSSRGAAFTEATDYEGGRWGTDGEFYAKGDAKRNQVRTDRLQ